MHRPIVRTASMDRKLMQMRRSGWSWDAIGDAFGLHRWTVIKRARSLGIPHGRLSGVGRAGRPKGSGKRRAR